jgi:hypothetical protein
MTVEESTSNQEKAVFGIGMSDRGLHTRRSTDLDAAQSRPYYASTSAFETNVKLSNP